MQLTENSYIQQDAVYYEGILKEIKKKEKEHLRPIYEAFTNSLESTSLLSDSFPKKNRQIIIRICSHKNLLNQLDFDHIEIEDNGIGFNDVNFERLIRYKDTRKGFNNKGSGRIQLIHFFEKCEIESTYSDGNNTFKKRSFIISKTKPFLDNNTIIFYKTTKVTDERANKTVVLLKGVTESSEKYYSGLNINDLKDFLINHYILYFCSHKAELPKIKLEQLANNSIINEIEIQYFDIPLPDKEDTLTINYSTISEDGHEITKTANNEIFTLKAFKINKNKLDKNAIKLTSKQEIVDNIKINISLLSADDSIDGNRYLVLLSSSYIDNLDVDVRGEFRIPHKDEFKKQNNMYSVEEILIDDIQDNVNNKMLSIYSEIKDKIIKKGKDVEKLKEMFLLNEETLKNLTIELNDSEEKILEKVYSSESKVAAKKDAEIKKKFDELDSLDPNANDYQQKFENQISELVKQIPLQDRATLTHYVARRTLVLELFQKILDRRLSIQSSGRNDDEKLLHNLIFRQASKEPQKSDLWLLNEDFIYFKGASDSKLKNLEIKGTKIFKETLTDEEEKFRLSLGEDRYDKEPDVLLFPEENKCIILEFKNPNVNVSEHLQQINKYATYIRNFTKDEFQFDTFYGYLIGEKIDGDDVMTADTDFKYSYHFDYVFRPSKPILGKFGRPFGSIYTEVIKYSTLLKRSKLRNQVFIDKILS